MRKITLFLASLFCAVGAMAQEQEYGFELIDLKSNANEMLYTNAPCTNTQWGDQFTSWDVLFDINPATFLHTEYANNGASLDGLDHYIRVDLGAGNEISAFKFEYTTRGGNAGYDFPQKFIISGSNEENGTYTEIGRIESGCPIGVARAYSSQVFTSETPYRYLRFMVTETNTNRKGEGVEHNYWHMGEFSLYKAIPEVVYETEEMKTPTEDGVYRIYWKQNNRGYLAYHDSYPTKGVLADVTYDDASNTDYPSLHFSSATDPVELEWYLFTSTNSGNKYLFNVTNGKFLSYSNESADNAKAAYFDAARPCPITITENTRYTDYSIIKANVNGTECLLSSGCGTASRTGYPIRWNSNISGDMGDGGSPLIFVKVKDFPVEATILEQAQAAINDYENPVEADVTFGWTTSTPWQAIEVPYYTSSVLNDNARANGIKYIEGEVTIAGARTATITFDFTDGDHKLNVRGVEVIDEAGNVVAGDYKVGEAGSNDQNNPVYTVSVAEAGTYTVRCYATDGDGDNFSQSEGTITVSYDKLNVMDLTKSVTFAAEYATLYLGYKVAIPAGVEAYILTGVNGEWAHLEQIEGIIPANTGVILKKVAAYNTYNFYYSSDEAADVEGNCLQGSIADRYVQGEAFVLGIPAGETEAALCKAVLNKVDNTSFKNNANKAYLQAVPAAVQVLRFNFDGTTGIEDAVVAPSFDANAPIYDLSGRRVVNAVKGGLYIQNGKKFIVK